MPNYSYVAINAEGKEVTGIVDAANPTTARRLLQNQKLLPTKVVQGESHIENGRREDTVFTPVKVGKRRNIRNRDILDFTRQLVTLLKAGVPILTALETLAGQIDNPNFAEILIQVAEDIAGGSDLSQALSRHPKAFNELYVNAVKAGETGGVLDEILKRLGNVIKRDIEIKQRVTSAMRYPVLVVCGMCVAFLVMVTMVVPKFAAIFKQVELDLPLATKIMMIIADIVMGYWWLIGICIFALVAGIRFFLRSSTGRYMWDGIALKIPIFGPLVLKTAMTRFTSMFETLSRSGVPILQIFGIASKTIGNIILGKAITRAAEGIEYGRGIAVSLAETGLFPPLVVKMISVGEASGSIDDMLANIAEYYEEEVNRSVDTLTAMIEPILTVGMGGMVLLLALAIFLPMWDMTKMAMP